MSLTVVPTHSASHRADAKARWALYGHDDEVLSGAAWKNLFATCSADGVALIWRLPSASQVKGPENVCRVATGGPAAVDVCFVSDKHLATAQGDATVSLWDVETGKRLASLSRTKVPERTSWPVLNAVTMAARDVLCFGGDDGYVAFADTRAPTVTSSVNRKAPVTALRAIEDGTLYVGDACGHVSGFDQRASWRKFMDVKCATNAVASVACGSRGDQAAVFTRDGKASLIDTQPFAVHQQDRLLTSVDVGYGEEDRALKRGDWSDALDTLVFPADEGTVACLAPSRFSVGVARSLRSVSGAERDDEERGHMHFATFVQDSYVLFGGSASLSLLEL